MCATGCARRGLQLRRWMRTRSRVSLPKRSRAGRRSCRRRARRQSELLALPRVAGGREPFEASGRHTAPIEQNGDLVADAELVRRAPALIEQMRDVPFVVRAEAECDRRAQRIVVAETGPAHLAGFDRAFECTVRCEALIEV